MNTQTSNTKTSQQCVPGFNYLLADTIRTATGNALQDALIEGLEAVAYLCVDLGVSLPQHERLFSHITLKCPVLPALISPELEKPMLDALRKVHATRTMLLKVWFGRAIDREQDEVEKEWMREEMQKLG